MDIDETPLPGWPIPIVYYWSLNSFQAHWSGDAHSDPYDWDIGDVGGVNFAWNIETHSFLSFAVGDGPPDIAYIDGPAFLDRRSGDLYYITAGHVIQAEAVPDNSPTLMLLGIALVSFLPLSSFLHRLAVKPAMQARS
jgi:hypothetical protein